MGRAATGTVRRLKSGRWQARHQGPDGVRRPAPTTFTTKSAAQAWLRAQSVDVERGTWTGDTRASVSTSLRDYAEEWLQHRTVRGRPLSPRTRAEYRKLLAAYVLPRLGSRPLHGITRQDAATWYSTLPADRPTTRARVYALLRGILSSAVDDGHLQTNPVAVRGAGQVEREHRVDLPTDRQLDRLVKALPERLRVLVTLTRWSGLRWGEISELRRGDVDLAAGVIRVRRAVVLVNGEFVVGGPKSTAGARDTWLPRHVVAMLTAHLEHVADDPSALLFPSASDPERHMHQASFGKAWHKAREKAGLSTFRFHDLRHVHLTRFAQLGATQAELMQRAGHSTSAAAQRYQHAANDRMRLLVERMAADHETSS